MTVELSPAIEDAILADIAGGVPLRQSCRLREIGRGEVQRRIETDAAFAARFAKAQALGLEALAEEMLEIADDGRNDWEERERAGEKTDMVRNPEQIQRSKLRIDTRLRLLARWDALRVPADPAQAGAPPPDPVAGAARIAALLGDIAAREAQAELDFDDPA